MSRKQKSDYREELDASLSIVRRDILALGEFEHGWQSLSVQLSKILCDGNPTLLQRIIKNPTFHPTRKPELKSQLSPTRVTYQLRVPWRIKAENGSMIFECFDESANPIDLETWLDLVFVEVQSEPLSIGDFIRVPRDKEAAHSHEKQYKKLCAAKGGLTVVSGSTQIAPLPLGLGVIGSYVLGRIESLLKDEP